MAHWRTMLTSEHFSAADLWDDKDDRYREVAVQIVSVSKGEVVGEKGRKKGMPFLQMKTRAGRALEKRFGLCATNGETVSSIVGSPDAKKWPGHWITLYVTRVEVGKGMKDAIRIRPQAPFPFGDAKPGAAPSSPARDANTTGAGATHDEAASQLSPPEPDAEEQAEIARQEREANR